jgi:hypothetical protein
MNGRDRSPEHVARILPRVLPARACPCGAASPCTLAPAECSTGVEALDCLMLGIDQ